MAEFKIMDRVFYPFYGKGTVVEAWKTDEPYPIRVVWDKPPYKNEPWSSFTRDGVMSISRFVGADKVKLILVKVSLKRRLEELQKRWRRTTKK